MKIVIKQLWRYHIPNVGAQIMLGAFFLGSGLFSTYTPFRENTPIISHPLTYFGIFSIAAGLYLLLRDPVGYLKEIHLGVDEITGVGIFGQSIRIRYDSIKLVKVTQTTKRLSDCLIFKIHGRLTAYVFNFWGQEERKFPNAIHILKLHSVPIKKAQWLKAKWEK